MAKSFKKLSLSKAPRKNNQAGTYNLYNVSATSWRSTDVEVMFSQRYVPAGEFLKDVESRPYYRVNTVFSD